MARKNVLIVARTRMGGDKVCVGALSESGENLRLMNQRCASDLEKDSSYRIGEWWQIMYDPCGSQTPPHVEDISVSATIKVGNQPDLAKYLLQKTKPWKGAIDVLFDGKIQFTQNGSGYISAASVPTGATGFWIPNSPLKLDASDSDKLRYRFKHGRLSYVGVDENVVEVIPPGQLVRVSLARWWKPNDAEPTFEERCYAQLSGWY